jgi:acyl transferase domain-containing protein
MVDLFAHPTVRSLARHLSPEPSALPSADEGGELEAASRVARPRPRPVAPSSGAAFPEGAVAVVGLAGRFPGAKSVERFWENLRAGVESVRRFSNEELLAAGFPPELLADPKLVRAHGVLDDPDLFDAAFFGYSPREAQVIDPQQRLFLEVAWEALESAGYGAEDGRGSVGVFAGVSENSYVREIHRRPELVRALGPHQISISNNPDYLPTRVSYKLGLDGPSVNVQTACSTSLVAVHLACLSLRAGECDLALAGGSAVRAREVHPYRWEEGGTASPDGRLRAFDARAGGLVGGSGVGVVVLKRLADALADGDTVRAVIRGTAANNDGARRIGFTAPGVDGQAAAIRAALAAAGVPAASVGYVEAHGTATALGDPIEVAALTRAFAGGAADLRQWCALGSVKTNIGHLDAAAGVTGLIKAVLALERREIPPSLHFERPNPQIDFAASPFFVNTRLRPWESGGVPRRAGVSSFGLGGTNAHAVLEEAPRGSGRGREPGRPAADSERGSGPERSAELLVLSARTETALERATGALAAHLTAHPEGSLADAAWTLQVGRRVFPWRRAVVARGRAEAAEALAARDRRWERSGLAPDEPPRLAFLFPGQGAQYPGMGEPLYREEPVFRETLDRCCEVLEPELGLDLREILYPGSEKRFEEAAERLATTELTQPGLFAVEYALARLWRSWGAEPAAMVGHSIGEYVAATLAGVFALEDALRLVAARGRLMAALPAGAMLAVRLPEAELAPLLGEDGPVAIAAVNGPDACVASGPAEAVAALAERLTARGVESRGLHTSHAFHSPMMEPAVEPFRELVARVERRPPAIPFASNVTGAWITAGEATDPGYWARHLRSPVRFGAGLATLVGSPSSAADWALLEVGPGRGLATLARRHPAAAEARAIVPSMRHPRQAGSDAERLLAALGALWVAGLTVDWRGHHGDRARRRVPLPTYPFERRSHWLDGLPMVARSPERPAEEAPDAAAAARERPELSATEARVAEVWREVLGVEEPAPGDDFFELGGTSLMAVQLGSRMREALEVELPADFLLQASTLAEQAALAEEAEALAAAGEPSGPAPPPSCMVRLQRGADGRPPLFAVHQVGGHVYSFRALAKALGPDLPFYGLRARGLEPGEGDPLRSVEAMAERYLALVREVQPAGPYRVAGASMGGMVALQIAQRLREAGEEVPLLAVMDTPCGAQMPRRPREPAEFTALIFAGVGLPLTYDELRPLDPDAQLVHALEKAREMGAVGPDFDLDQARRLRAVLEANVAALYDYRPRPYPGPLVLYRAAERRNQDSARPELAWVELAHGGLDFVVVPGNHATMHEPPGVQAMADDLRRRLAGR